tara:strand:+ start:36 stop:488 length:453 start_codon:yes stop_codon:yes gene_type:complete
MSLGFDAISALPFAATGLDNNVNVNVLKNQLTITIGSIGIIADSVVENLTGNQVTLGTGTLSITGTANVGPLTGSQVSLGLGTFVVSAGATAITTGNALTLATGNVTVTGTANVLPTGASLTLNTNEPGVITWNDIIPGANMVWTPIKPY